jgi:hypothetical protein
VGARRGGYKARVRPLAPGGMQERAGPGLRTGASAIRAIHGMRSIASRVKKPHLGKTPMKFYLTCHVRCLALLMRARIRAPAARA